MNWLNKEQVGAAIIAALRFCFFKKIVYGEFAEKSKYKFDISRPFKMLLAIWAFGFAVFFMEEADQKLGFANFAAMDAGRWDLVANNLRAMEEIRNSASFMNNIFYSTHPALHKGYDAYFNIATVHYLQTMWEIVDIYDGTDQSPIVPDSMANGGAVPEAPIPLAAWGNIADPPILAGAMSVEEAAKWAETNQEIQVIVPCIEFVRGVTGSGNPQGVINTHTNFKLLSWTPSVIDAMSEMKGKWVIVSGEVVRWEQWNEIILGSSYQIIEVHDLFAGGR